MSSSQAWWEAPQTPPNESGEEQDFTSQKLNLDELPSEEEQLPTRRIHILGTGSIGTLVASALKQLPNPPPISLLIHRDRSYEQFKEGGRIIRLINKASDVNDEQVGYDVDLLGEKDNKLYWQYIPHEHKYEPVNPIPEAERMETGEVFIYTLIVTVKGPATEQALNSVKHRVNAKTTILLMQNGLGQIDELNERVFTDPATRPTYMLGVVAHGCYMDGPFAVVHAGVGTIALGVYRDTDKFPMPPKGTESSAAISDESLKRRMFPTEKDLYSNITARYLLRTMTRCPFLACAAYPYLDLFQLQLEKLVSNCIINPLTAILDVRNGILLSNPPLTRVQRLLISEIALVIRGLPELKGIPNVRARFSPTRLELRVQTMTTQTAQNSSSMREDMRLIRLTEVDYINGYIIKRGEEQGIKCVLNYMIMQLIKGKNHILYHGEDNIRAAPYGRRGLKAEQDSSSDGGVVLEDVSGPRNAER